MHESELTVRSVMFADTGFYQCGYQGLHAGAGNASVYIYVEGECLCRIYVLWVWREGFLGLGVGFRAPGR